MVYQAALFDLDGTLVKTADSYIFSTASKTFQDLGIEPTLQIINKYVRNNYLLLVQNSRPFLFFNSFHPTYYRNIYKLKFTRNN